MLRIIYTSTEIITIINNTPTMGTTYTPYNIIVCSEQDALNFFANYPQEEIDKIIEFINTNPPGDTFETIQL
jgi:hypothetical protein